MFRRIYYDMLKMVMEHGEEVEVGQWQSQDVRDKPEMISRELRHVTVDYQIPGFAQKFDRAVGVEVLQDEIQPNLPWAEDHFLERVSGEPLNPPPSEQWWPFRVNGNSAHKEGEIFSHTYPERMWPRFANIEGKMSDSERQSLVPHVGLRYEYGDLIDVVELLTRNPLTRQAYLPIWFPEDTGAVSGQRVPCTLGYHFMIRNGKAEIVYHIRSCDMLRHFPDDAYMACRLLQWVVGMLRDRSIDVIAHRLIMHIASFHIFRGDYERVKHMIKNYEDEEETIYGAAV